MFFDQVPFIVVTCEIVSVGGGTRDGIMLHAVSRLFDETTFLQAHRQSCWGQRTFDSLEFPSLRFLDDHNWATLEETLPKNVVTTVLHTIDPSGLRPFLLQCFPDLTCN